MNFDYTIDENRRMIFIEFSGSFSPESFIACIERLWSDPAYRRDYEGIADIREVESNYTLTDLQRVIGFLKKNPRTNTSRWAVITASPLAAACSYVYQRSMAPVHRLEVFSTWEAAATFIGWQHPCPLVTPRHAGNDIARAAV
ncbi:MAG TPA: hypothetical protein VIO38_05215 [Rariglobus sp.]